MTIFGRDALLTSWMLLPLDARVARGTLETLAETQGRVVEPRTEGQPGRILHEIRSGLLDDADAGEETVYYGSVDATPLFVMLARRARTGGVARRRRSPGCCRTSDRALDWIEDYGDRDGDGFVEYERATDRGLVNQGWKDSFDGITFADGRPGRRPARAGRGAGLRLRRAARGGPTVSGRTRRRPRPAAATSGPRRSSAVSTRRSGCRTAAATPSALDARQAAGRRARLQHGALPVDRHRRRGHGAGGGRST